VLRKAAANGFQQPALDAEEFKQGHRQRPTVDLNRDIQATERPRRIADNRRHDDTVGPFEQMGLKYEQVRRDAAGSLGRIFNQIELAHSPFPEFGTDQAAFANPPVVIVESIGVFLDPARLLFLDGKLPNRLLDC